MHYKHFTLKNGIYLSKRIGYISLLFGLFWFVLSAWLFITSLDKGSTFKEPYWIGGLIGTIAGVRLFAQQIAIDTGRNVITKSYLGLLKTKCAISDIKGFETLKHIAIIFHNGTDIIIRTQPTGQSVKNVKILERVGRTKNVESIINEIKQIISNEQ